MTEVRGASALLCRAGARLCAVLGEHVAETMRPLPVAALGAAPPFVLGLSVVRGTAIPVVDLRLLLGASAARSPGRFVVTRAGARGVALAVDSIERWLVLPSAELASLPPLVRDVDTAAIEAIAARDADLLYVLDSSRVLPSAVWEQAARNELTS